MTRAAPLLWLFTSAAFAQVAGPPAPVAPTKTPSQESIDRVKAQELRGAPRRCRQGPGGEITVCGNTNGASPYRLPLPTVDESPQARGGGVDIGGSPVARKPATGMTFTLKPGSRATLKGIGQQEAPKPIPETPN